MKIRKLTPKEKAERDRNIKVWYDEKGRRRVTIKIGDSGFIWL